MAILESTLLKRTTGSLACICLAVGLLFGAQNSANAGCCDEGDTTWNCTACCELSNECLNCDTAEQTCDESCDEGEANATCAAN